MEWLKDWVRDRIADARNILSRGIDAVQQFAKAILDTFVRVFRTVRTAFVRVTMAVRHARTWAVQTAWEVYHTLRWIILVEIPRRAVKAYNDAVKWAYNRVNWAVNMLRQAISMVDKWAKAAVKTLNDWARAAVKWVTDRANWLYQQWTTFVRDVLPRLLRPDRLIAWLAAELVKWFWRWLPGQADRIATWVLGRSMGFTQWLSAWLIRNLERLI